MIGDRSEQLMHEVCAGREPLSALEDLAMQYYDIKESLDKRFKNIHNEKRVPEEFEAVKTQIAWQNKITHAPDTCRSMLTIAEKQESLPEVTEPNDIPFKLYYTGEPCHYCGSRSSYECNHTIDENTKCTKRLCRP